MPKQSIHELQKKLQKITKAAHIPAISYTYVEPKEESKNKFTSTSLTLGKKKQSTNTDTNGVDANTQFPASSPSKIVFTYLVLQWVKENQINLDGSLHDFIKKKQIELGKSLDHVLTYDRFVEKGEYPDQAKQLTIRHILSHTTGLPNVGADPHSTLAFNSEPGEKYSYSGEAFFYLQKVIEAITGKNLENLAIQYVFKPLGMENSTFLPKAEDDPNVVKVHTELGKPKNIYIGDPPVHAAGSLLTTADDFSKFMAAWLENMDDPIFKQAFEPTKCDIFLMSVPNSGEYKDSNLKHLYLYKDEKDQIFYQKEGKKVFLEDNKENQLSETIKKTLKFDQPENKPVECHNADTVDKILAITSKADHIHFKTCGLGWHIYRNAETKEVIAYQYGENPNTRSFVALNVTDKKGAAFFTNSENGMRIANELLSSSDFAPIGNTDELFKGMPNYPQGYDPVWQNTLEGQIAEDQKLFDIARDKFKQALEISNNHESNQLRLKWFNEVHPINPEKQTFPQLPKESLEQFAGKLTNRYNEERELFVRGDSLIHEQFGKEIKLVRVSKTDFLPEKDQSFRISFNGDKVSIDFIDGANKQFDHHPLPKSQENSQLTSSTGMVSKKLDIKPAPPPIQRQQIDIENKKDNDKKITKDDIAFQATIEKKAAQEFSSKTEKKRITSTDDFNITYGKRPGK